MALGEGVTQADGADVGRDDGIREELDVRAKSRLRMKVPKRPVSRAMISLLHWVYWLIVVLPFLFVSGQDACTSACASLGGGDPAGHHPCTLR